MESLVHYINPAHAISLLGVLNEQRLKGQLCDVLLVVGDQKYQAHRSILAASSEYFHSLFARRECGAQTAVQLDFCEPDAFENVLNYIYSSSLFVDRGSLAAIQELGYSLGIPFLTNIMSTKPQVSYSVSRKRMSFSEEEEDNGCQQRSVIVRQSRGDPPSAGSSHHRGLNPLGKATSKQANPAESRDVTSARAVGKPSQCAGQEEAGATSRKATAVPRKSADPEGKSHPSASLARERAALMSCGRPQLTSSVSFSESQIQHSRLQPDAVGIRDEPRAPSYGPKQASSGHANESSQAIDRSGPLIKSLLRRSLSMDSPVPVFSPALELKTPQSREQSVVKMAARSPADAEPAVHKAPKSNAVPPLVLKSRHCNRYEEEEEDAHAAEVHVKTEPSSPLADPSDIIRITVGDNLPVNFRDFQINFDEGPRGFFKHSGKRKARLDSRRNPVKKSRGVASEVDEVVTEDNRLTAAPHGLDKEDNDGAGESRQSRMFKCWNCLKVFRSNAGLYRHVNMYHNPEKPYSCDICHKRFHTNFKVWTHCQTQHGVVQNPAPSSSSYTVLDEKFQRKLIDIVREREIKKALIMKLRRNKQGGLQSQPFGKRSLRRSRSYMCPYCGKLFWFQSQYRQHLKMHNGEKSDQEAQREEDELLQMQERTAHLKENKGKDVYPCRLCNEKLTSLVEQGNHERGCRHATVCPYCGLRFSSPMVKKEHETHCEYKKLTCLECMRTFKSSFSIWRHQVEVHNQNMMTVEEQMSLGLQENNGEVSDHLPPMGSGLQSASAGSSKDEVVYSDSSGPVMFDSEDSSFMAEDLSTSHHQGELKVKEEPQEEAVDDRAGPAAAAAAEAGPEEPGVWPCEKCGKLFSTHKQLERHQELLCHIKPFICHICNKAFRTNFRLWSHFQSHMAAQEEPPGSREGDGRPSSPSPSPPPATSAAPWPPAPPRAPHSPKPAQPGPSEAGAAPAATKFKNPEQEKPEGGPPPKADAGAAATADKPLTPQESDTLFYHAPTLSALTFKRQYMCKLCHRTFKTAFSLWSHEQSHTNP
ncbi:zinc finger and BTB domain-containing protein 21 [Anguilla anguilla]|uniref:zinc finger and BTB domain-containing protein 21 n=1 Tax=Anguilla anguilla TaxID=7936 RepID=UPI0015B211DD|nr:zinc finger and BTB domain-containing protein 21 [Anguilla anguilla]XP_035288134.1 zinc finger and BTB domain-containing protein 21 [Anguilla anguilla]